MNIATATVNAGSPPPPVIQESANQSLLNPVDVRNTLMIEVTDPALQDADQVSVTWTGAPGSGPNGSLTTAFINAGSTRPLVSRLPNSLVIFNLGNTVMVTYTIIRGTAAPVTSEPQVVYVLPLAQRDWPRPFITQAEQSGEGPMLDVKGLTDFILRINAWPLGGRGQYLWLRLTGTNADDSVFDEEYWKPPSDVITDQFNRFGYYERSHSATALHGLKDRSVLTLKLMVGLQGSQDPSLAQPLAHRNYIVLTSAVVSREVTIEEALDDANLNPINATTHLTAVLNYASESTDLVSVTWTAESGTPAAGSRTTSPVPVGAMPMKIPLPVPLVPFSIGKAAGISFTYTRGSSAPVTSPPWPLNVLPIPKASLVSPVIAEANGTTELDLKDVIAGATLRFGIWPHILTGQRVSLMLMGRNTSGAEHNLTLWTDTRNAVHRAWVTAGSYSTIIQSGYLLALMPGSKLSIVFSVYMDQVPGSAARTDFNAQEYTIKDTR
ncbi:hypothetical protein PMI21_02152 [Pseudomonas sp. GM18]|uniref:hypothetical protein n=1 Tax=Pseudomonas sp. GM18 TaxID=1144324 RepID=UPI00027254C9|nr:hypothetical protein [Pseudomonas sp. GM18]EJM18580.1 hypothetical protein PMI21_02152 [Pseudomonas sp. GM18]